MTDRLVLWGLLSVALLICVITDIATRRILDVVTVPAAALALGFRLWREGVGDLESGLISGLAAGAGAAALLTLWAVRGRIGWGDIKLLFVVGAAFGYPLVMGALMFITLCGALQGVITLIWKGSLWTTTRGALRSVGQRLRLTKVQTSKEEAHYIPYGVAIALGSFWAMWWERTQ